MSPSSGALRQLLVRLISRKGKYLRGKHPDFVTTHVRCNACGTEFAIRSSRAELSLGVCSSCHPAYTGIERPTAHGSRVERFERRRARAATTA